MLKNRIEFNIPFIAGKERSRVRRAGSHVFQYTPERTRANMQTIARIFEQVANQEQITNLKKLPVSISIEVFGYLPKSRPKKIASEPNTFKPDVDNIAKLVMDALNGIAYEDDKQVTSLNVTKRERTRATEQDFDCMSVRITYLTEPNEASNDNRRAESNSRG